MDSKSVDKSSLTFQTMQSMFKTIEENANCRNIFEDYMNTYITNKGLYHVYFRTRDADCTDPHKRDHHGTSMILLKSFISMNTATEWVKKMDNLLSRR